MKKHFVVLSVGLVAFALVVSSFAAPEIRSPSEQLNFGSQQRVAWEYATLITDGTDATWQPGDSNERIQTFTLEKLYRQLGGTSRTNLNNLLNQIGKDGWELVATDQMNWNFKRLR